MSELDVKKILVIDDSTDYRLLLIKHLKKAFGGSEIDEYDPSWGKPPDAFPWQCYQLLILDYDLGNGENGLEWLRQYKTSSNFPATIMLTAEDNEDLVVNAIRYGAHDFLRKDGLTKDKLLKAVKNALTRHAEETIKFDGQKIRTHIYNKEKFFSSLQKLQKNIAVFLIEVEKFHTLQETLGLIGTDNFTTFISQSLSDFLSEKKSEVGIARISDSTSALLFENIADPNIAADMAKALCEYFDKLEYKHEEEKIDFNINIGAYHVLKEEINANELLSKTEMACRTARNTSGNSYILKTDGDDLAPEIDKETEKMVKAAIKQDRVQPLFQALVLVSDISEIGSIQLYQTRANIRDEDNNIIEAKEFLPVLKKSKSQKMLDRWVIRYCVSLLANIKKQQKEKYGIFIKLSEQSIIDTELTEWVEKLIDYVKIPDLGESIIFELDSEDYLTFQRQAKLQLNKLRIKLNSSIAISNIINIDQLKKCFQNEKFNFIMFSPEHAGDKKMIFSEIEELATYCKANKTISVATKIDSGEYLALSASAGVDCILGHFVQPPMENIVATETVEVLDH